jgi:LTXXQ motif family protein
MLVTSLLQEHRSLKTLKGILAMLKLITAGATALFVTASALAYAQAPSGGASERLTAADWESVTDARITLVKGALQLTPDQEKLWPPVEAAIRARAKDRQARIAAAAERAAELRDRSRIEVLRERNPVEFLERRAAALAQRAAELKTLADAWKPLYQTLNPEQKRRMTALTIFVFREMRNAAEQRRMQSEDDDDE